MSRLDDAQAALDNRDWSTAEIDTTPPEATPPSGTQSACPCSSPSDRSPKPNAAASHRPI